jgi:hypothetical protein
VRTAGRIVLGALASLLVVVLLVDRETGRAAAAGMAGPLVAVVVSWVVTERAHRRGAAAVFPVMIRSFVWKVVFFGAYVAAALTLADTAPVPFVVSFTSYFVALYFVQAMLLQRLVTRGAPDAPPPTS